MATTAAPLPYTPAAFSQGRMDFAWEQLSEAERDQAYADWAREEKTNGCTGGTSSRAWKLATAATRPGTAAAVRKASGPPMQ